MTGAAAAACPEVGGVLALDPASTGYLGLAHLHPDSGLQAWRVRVYDAEAGGLARTWEERVAPIVQAWLPRTELVVAEVPPPTARSDSGRSGSQASIGFGVGRCVGMLERDSAAAAVPTLLVGVGEARRALRPLRPPGRVRLDPIAPRRVGPGWTWAPSGCVHVLAAGTDADTGLSIRESMRACPVCARIRTGRADRATRAREQAKREAWATFQSWAPATADALLAEALGRANGQVREAWTLPGVVDAAEAALLAWVGHQRLMEGRR